ncbi:MAG: DUF502 domain-containing protein [Gammaproteobacteria bacterium]|nr:DUF502 domain-containing protein [Gammaproteobacteria bacterium]
MRRIARTFASGLVTILPVLVTIAVLAWLVQSAEAILGAVVRVFIPDEAYLRGMGLFAAFGLIFGIGLVAEGILFQRILDWVESWLNRIPLVKTVYNAVRDLMDLVSKSRSPTFNKVVLAQLPGTEFKLLGFVTVEDFHKLPLALDAGTVAVYFPMSYQIGGYTLFLPRSCLTPVDMTLEEGMRFAVTAGMSRPG